MTSQLSGRTAGLVLCIALAVGAMVRPACGQPLADRVPADAIVYLGWGGFDASRAAYDKSHLKGALASWDLRGAINEVLLPLATIAGDAEMPEMLGVLADVVVPTMWDRPWAVYFGGLDWPQRPPGARGEPVPQVRFAVVMEPGPHMEKVRGLLNRMLADPGARSVLGVHATDKTLVVHAVGMSASTLARLGVPVEGAAAQSDKPITASKRFTEAMWRVAAVSSPVSVWYADLEALFGLVDGGLKALAPRGGEAELGQWHAVRDTLGLSGAKRLISVSGFDGADWTTAGFLALPAPRQGVFTMFDTEPIDPKALASVPRSATWVQMARVKLPDFLPLARKVMERIDPKMAAEFDEGMAEVKAEIGIDLHADLVATLGDQWLMYGDASVPGAMGMNMIAIHWLKDAERFTKTLDVLERMMNDAMSVEDTPGFQMRVQRSELDGVTVRYVNLAMVNPAWAVHDGKLYLAMSSQAISSRIQLEEIQTSPITKAAGFTALMERMKAPRVHAVSYADLARTGPQMLQQLNMSLGMLAMGMQQDPAAPPMDLNKVMPQLGKLLPHLQPMGDVSWVDEAGLHTRSISPFPGAGTLSPMGSTELSGVAAVSLGVGILLPSLSRAREVADRTISSSNLAGIYKAAYVWSVTHNDQFPPDLGTLVKDGSIGPKSVINPRAEPTKTVPDGLTADELAEWANENSDYVYLRPKAGAAVAPDAVVAYEKIQPGVTEGINILFGDSHVEFVDWDRAVQLLRKAGVKTPSARELEMQQDGGPSTDRERAFGVEPAPPGQAFYYEIETKQFYTDRAGLIPPVQSPNGKQAVRAHFFSCGACNADNRFLGYLEKYTPEAKKKIEANPNELEFFEEAFVGRLYCAPASDPSDPKSWVDSETPAGFAIVEKLHGKCAAGTLHYCQPE